MYVSSDGTKKDVSTLNTEYILNALNKAQREIFNSTSLDEFNKNLNNVYILREELEKRIHSFLSTKIDNEEYL